MHGAAVARRAARELEDGAGIPSTSVAALLERARAPSALDAAARARCSCSTRPAMLPTRELAAAGRAGRAGSTSSWCSSATTASSRRSAPAARSAALHDRLPVIELEQNRRQVAEWERDALRLVREGARARGGSALRRRGPDRGRRGRRRAAPARWWRTGGRRATSTGAVMIAQRRVDVDDLNGRAHALMRARGRARCRGGDRRGRVVLGRRPRRRASQRPPARRRQRRSRRRRRPSIRRRGRIDLDAARGPACRCRATILERPTRHGRPRARARLRDHRPPRPGHDLPPDVHPRDGLSSRARPATSR